MTNGTRRGEGSASRPGRSLPRGNDPVLIVQEAEWAAGPVWTDEENLASTGIRSSERPSRSQSLYRLRYPSPHTGRTRTTTSRLIQNAIFHAGQPQFFTTFPSPSYRVGDAIATFDVW
jgi:hypothetical protein